MSDTTKRVQNRRHPEAGSLRDFFREQLQWLTGSGDSDHADIDEAMGTLLHRTNPAIAYTAPRAGKQRLRKAINSLLVYIDDLIDGLPLPVEVTRERFSQDDTLRSFFLNADEMTAFLSHDHGLNKFIKEYPGPRPEQVYALLAMAKSEKREFGLGLEGDMLVRDIPHTAVSFANHRLHHLGLEKGALYGSLKECLFDSYAHQLKQAMLEQNCTVQSAPEKYLEVLEEELYHPDRHLRTESNQLQVNRMGIVVNKESKEPYCDLDLHQLAIGKAPSRTVLPIIIPTAELNLSDDFLGNASHLLNI